MALVLVCDPGLLCHMGVSGGVLAAASHTRLAAPEPLSGGLMAKPALAGSMAQSYPPIPAAASFSLASTVPSSTGLSLLCALRDEGSSPAFSEVGGDGWSFLECTCHKHWQRVSFQTFIWRLLPWLIVGLSEMEGGFVRKEDMRVLRCYVMMSELFCKETEADRRATWVLGFPNTLPPLFNK